MRFLHNKGEAMGAKKNVDIKKIDRLREEAGLSQSALAERLGVTRAAVSGWLTGKGQPKVANLGKIATILGVKISDLFEEWEPVKVLHVRHRQKRARANVPENIERMIADAGYALDKLAAYLPPVLPIEIFKVDSSFKGTYPEIQQLVSLVRKQLGIGLNDAVSYNDIACLLKECNVVIIPVGWGESDEDFPVEALLITSEVSKRRWMYLNIEAKLHHFNFISAHELFHVLASSACFEEEVEDRYADLFAQSLLFPENVSQKAFEKLISLQSDEDKFEVCYDYAEQYQIHPYQVFKAANSYAANSGLAGAVFDDSAAYQQLDSWAEERGLLADMLFSKKLSKVSQDEYVETLSSTFCTSIFNALEMYVRSSQDAARMIHTVLAMSYEDVLGLHSYWKGKNAAKKATV